MVHGLDVDVDGRRTYPIWNHLIYVVRQRYTSSGANIAWTNDSTPARTHTRNELNEIFEINKLKSRDYGMPFCIQNRTPEYFVFIFAMQTGTRASEKKNPHRAQNCRKHCVVSGHETHRSDLFSLRSILVKLLRAVRPFAETSDDKTILNSMQFWTHLPCVRKVYANRNFSIFKMPATRQCSGSGSQAHILFPHGILRICDLTGSSHESLCIITAFSAIWCHDLTLCVCACLHLTCFSNEMNTWN